MEAKQLFSIKCSNEQMLVTAMRCELEQPFPKCVCMCTHREERVSVWPSKFQKHCNS